MKNSYVSLSQSHLIKFKQYFSGLSKRNTGLSILRRCRTEKSSFCFHDLILVNCWIIFFDRQVSNLILTITLNEISDSWACIYTPLQKWCAFCHGNRLVYVVLWLKFIVLSSVLLIDTSEDSYETSLASLVAAIKFVRILETVKISRTFNYGFCRCIFGENMSNWKILKLSEWIFLIFMWTEFWTSNPALFVTRAWKATSLKMRLFFFFFSGVKICKHWLVEEQ